MHIANIFKVVQNIFTFTDDLPTNIMFVGAVPTNATSTTITRRATVKWWWWWWWWAIEEPTQSLLSPLPTKQIPALNIHLNELLLITTATLVTARVERRIKIPHTGDKESLD